MLVYILVGVLLAVILYMLWSIVTQQSQLKREDTYYTENVYPIIEYPEYNGWWWPGTSMIYGTGGWWQPPYWRGVDRDWRSGWQPGHRPSAGWRGGGLSYQPPRMPGGGGGHPGGGGAGHPSGLPGMGSGGSGGGGGGGAPGGGGRGGGAPGGGGGGGHGGGGK